MLDGHMSTDFVLARRNAATFGARFVSVLLPTDVYVLQKDVVKLSKLGCKKKTDFECCWPLLYAFASVEESVVFSGMGADGHFCISKKGMLHYRRRIEEFRRKTFGNPGYGQRPIHYKIAGSYNKTSIMPYMSTDMQRVFNGTSWEEVNKPHQKQPILDAFPCQFGKIKVLPHTNLQMGDSGIAKHFKCLLRTDWNIGPWRSCVGIYNAVVAGRVG